MREHGSVVSVSQGFSQAPFTGGQDILYACSFAMRVVTGTAPYESVIGSGGCTTSSKVVPAHLSCTATAGGIVP
jgi:hypothetical protein